MGYPFDKSILLEPSRQKSVRDLACSEDAVFDESFADRLPSASAFDSDTFAKGALKRFTGNALPSCDAVVQDGEGRYFCIEFKNQRVGNIDACKILNKVFGSLLMVNMTSAQDIALRQLMKNMVFVVVFPEQDYSTMLGYALAKSASHDRPILWGLDRLVESEMLADAYTVTDKEFVRMGFLGNGKTSTLHDQP